MKIGIALTSIVILTGVLFYMVGDKWERFPKDICWAEIVAESATEEVKGEFVLISREEKKRMVVESEKLGGDMVIKKEEGSTVLSTPIFHPKEILSDNVKVFTASFMVNEGTLKKKGKTVFKCE